MAADQAVKNSGVQFDREDPFRCGVILGSGIGGLNEFEEQHARYLKSGPGRISPFVIPKMILTPPRAISRFISVERAQQFSGNGRASAANASPTPRHQWDNADVMVTGGSEAAMTPMDSAALSRPKPLPAQR